MKFLIWLRVGQVLILASPALAGSFRYEVVDYSTSATGISLANAASEQGPIDVEAEDKDGCGSRISRSFVALEHGLRLGISDNSDRRIRGFGMWIETEGESFSWEWFSRETGGSFERLWAWLTRGPDDLFVKWPERSRIRARTVIVAGVEKIIEIQFLTDVPLEASETGGAGRVLQRVTIKEGSVLTWGK